MSNTNQPEHQQESFLQPGQVIPAFTLPGADGMPHSPWDYKQRQHLVLLFTRNSSSLETRGLLRAFARAYTSFREEDCSILAISPDTVIANLHTQEELNLPYPLLADAKGEVISRYTQWNATAGTLNPSIALVDRYNVLVTMLKVLSPGTTEPGEPVEKIITHLFDILANLRNDR
jgi:peroxiredoxin